MEPNSSEEASSCRTLLPREQSTSPKHRSSLTWQRCPDPGYHEMTIMTRKCQRCSQSGTEQSCVVKLRNTKKGKISVGCAGCRKRHSGCIMTPRSREWLENYNLTGEKDWKPTASYAHRAITATASISNQGVSNALSPNEEKGNKSFLVVALFAETDPLPDLHHKFWDFLDQNSGVLLSAPQGELLEEFGIPGGDSSGGVTDIAAEIHQTPEWDRMQNILYRLEEDEPGTLTAQATSPSEANASDCTDRPQWTTMQNLLYNLERKPAILTGSSTHDPL
ncbi:hypothetical protein V865_006520 [Kwoniella europaea PYCC6329]|uniref:Zn(2)-C6 fungal-type domain-containing protein n=1 Tax=Kwoniella europaea PYCC6329 TaxID=1423913 RepID=A0AAX4KSY5_9TREE